MEICGLPCMQCETQCLASRVCRPKSGRIKQAGPAIPASPTPGVQLYHVCMYVPESARKRVTSVGNMQNPSGWYHGACVHKNGVGMTIHLTRGGALTAGCGVSSTVARSTWQNARPDHSTCSVLMVPCTRRLFDGLDVIGNVEDVAFCVWIHLPIGRARMKHLHSRYSSRATECKRFGDDDTHHYYTRGALHYRAAFLMGCE
jgi:hypothetical protein